MCGHNIGFLCFSFAVWRGGRIRNTHQNIIKTTPRSIEKSPRGTLFDAFLMPLGVLGAPWGVEAKNGSGDLERPSEPCGALWASFGFFSSIFVKHLDKKLG